jgi:hypothetical protein
MDALHHQSHLGSILSSVVAAEVSLKVVIEQEVDM